MVPRNRFGRAAVYGGATVGALLGFGVRAGAQSTLHVVPGQAAGEQLGQAVALVGDLDGDGLSEFAATSIPAYASRGALRLYSGADAHLVREVQGTVAGQRFGASLARVADVDGDLLPDLLVGAWSGSFTGASAAGYARVLSSATGATLREHRGDSAQDHFGWTVAGLGDLDGDGTLDYAVAAIDDDDNGGSAGSVRAFSGATGLALYTLRGTAAEQVFGTAIARVPDVDGDGRDEIAVGAPSFASSLRPGLVRLFSGASGLELWSVAGTANFDQFGGAVAGLEDLDGDGRGEVAVGARQLPTGTTGYVRILSGASGALVRELAGTAANAHFGASLSVAGDVDYDGFDDLWVGIPDAAGIALRVGRVECRSGTTGALLAAFEGPAANARLGTSLDGGLDVSGEGGPDGIAGALGDATAGLNAGAVRIFRPSDLAPPPPPPPPHVEESLEADRLIVSLAAQETQTLSLLAPVEHAGRRFVFLGSASGTEPGFSIFGLQVPLVPDRYMRISLFSPMNSALDPVTGLLDADGRATSVFAPGKHQKGLVGRTLHHAYVVLGARRRPVFASVPVAVTIAP